MIKLIRNSTYSNLICGFLGLFFLNISIDSRDKNPEHIAEDLSFNDQESIIELILEKVLGFENAIAEYDDVDSEEHNSKTSNKIDLTLHQNLKLKYTYIHIGKSKSKCSIYLDRLNDGYHEIDSPPPQV